MNKIFCIVVSVVLPRLILLLVTYQLFNWKGLKQQHYHQLISLHFTLLSLCLQLTYLPILLSTLPFIQNLHLFHFILQLLLHCLVLESLTRQLIPNSLLSPTIFIRANSIHIQISALEILWSWVLYSRNVFVAFFDWRLGLFSAFFIVFCWITFDWRNHSKITVWIVC